MNLTFMSRGCLVFVRAFVFWSYMLFSIHRDVFGSDQFHAFGSVVGCPYDYPRA